MKQARFVPATRYLHDPSILSIRGYIDLTPSRYPPYPPFAGWSTMLLNVRILATHSIHSPLVALL